MSKKQIYFQGIYRELSQKLSELVEYEGAESTCVNILEQLPIKVQVELINKLGKTNNPRLIPFLQLVMKELEGEVKKEAQKTLVKFSYQGFNIESMEISDLFLEKTVCFVSPTRLKGNCILVFLEKTNKEFQAHYFVLLFNHQGIKDYFQYRSFSETELLNNIRRMELVAISITEGLHLLKEAYWQNQKYGTKVAKGVSQYKKFLEKIEKIPEINHQKFLLKLQGNQIQPDKLINAYLVALKNMDAALIYDLATDKLQKKFGPRDEFLQNWCHPLEKYIFIKTVFNQSERKNDQLVQQIEVVASTDNEELRKITFQFILVKINQEYYIDNVDIKKIENLSIRDPLNPLNYPVYASVFNYSCSEIIGNFLEEHKDIYLTGEFEGGVCYKWFQTGDPLEKGIDISKDVYGEFILTNKELILFGENLKNVTEITYLLADKIKTTKELASLQLRGKGLFKVKEVYKVISEPEFLLSGTVADHGSSYFIPSISYREWYKYCLDFENKEIVTILEGQIKVFYLKKQDKLVEIIFHEGYGIINLFNTSLDNASKIFNFPAGKIFSEHNLLKKKDDEENWWRIRLISILNKDPLAKVYKPVFSPGSMARKLNLVISN